MSLLNKLAPLSMVVAAALITPTVGAVDLSKVNMDNGKKIFTDGKGSVPACTSCHSETGMGMESLGTPRLAGQVYQFLVKQLEDFATDKRMDTTMFVMNNNAKGLSQQDRIDVAAYLSQLDNEPEPSNLEELKANGTEVGETHIGKAIVNYGIHEKDVPACRSCHGFNGQGVDAIFPMIGMQKYTYLVNQLKKWRDGSRANDPHEAMQVVARKMSDADIRNVSAFLSTGATAYSMSNTRLPERHVPFLDH